MKKVILSLVVFATLSASAQQKEAAKTEAKPFKFSVGVDAGFPVSPSGNKGFIIGGDVQGEYAAASSVGITLSAGYLNQSYQSVSVGSVPVLAGVRYYFSDKKFYANAQAGLSFSTVSGGGSAFTYAPGVGYYITNNFDLGVKYLGTSKNGYNSGAILLRAAYNF